MISSLLGIGTSGMRAQSEGMSTIGENIANTQTAGYKAGTMTYADLWQPTQFAMANGIGVQGGSGAATNGVYHNWSPGVSEQTGIMTHLAIAGDGFFEVQKDGQSMYTRAGDFALVEDPATAGQYVLMRPGGDMLMDGNGALVTFNAQPTELTVGRDGALEVVGAEASVESIGLRTFLNPDSLAQVGSGVLRTTPGTVSNPTTETPGGGVAGYLQQGALELSNVDLTRELTQMIATQRAFQANSKTVRTADEMLQEILQLKR